jgi:hypothetical protein
MNWEAITAIAELLGVAAVLATLIYLARQVKQANQEARDATAWRITESIAQLVHELNSDSETAEIWCKGVDEFDSLSRVERERFVAMVAMWTNILMALHRTRKTSQIPGEYWDQVLESFAMYMRYPGFRKAVDSGYVNIPDYVRAEIQAINDPD